MVIFTDEWARRCCARMQSDAGYRSAAAGFTARVSLVMEQDPSEAGDRHACTFDLRRGACLQAGAASDADLRSSRYVFTGSAEEWRAVIEGALDPVAAVLQRRLRLTRGSVLTLAPHAAAARALVGVARAVGGRIPGG